MKESLQQLGFTPYEAVIYLCLLENGYLSAYEVAEKTGLYRQACYDAINRMLEKGYVTELHMGKSKKFNAAPPQMLLEDLQQQLNDFNLLIPQLNTLKRESEDPITVEVFKGKNVLRKSLGDVVSVLKKFGGSSCCTAVDETHYHIHDDIAVQRFIREMEKNNFKERVIIKKGATPLMPKTVSAYREIDEKYFNSYPVQIYGNTVQILLGGTPSHVIFIRNQQTADSFRKMFELMWLVAKEKKV